MPRWFKKVDTQKGVREYLVDSYTLTREDGVRTVEVCHFKVDNERRVEQPFFSFKRDTSYYADPDYITLFRLLPVESKATEWGMYIDGESKSAKDFFTQDRVSHNHPELFSSDFYWRVRSSSQVLANLGATRSVTISDFSSMVDAVYDSFREFVTTEVCKEEELMRSCEICSGDKDNPNTELTVSDFAVEFDILDQLDIQGQTSSAAKVWKVLESVGVTPFRYATDDSTPPQTFAVVPSEGLDKIVEVLQSVQVKDANVGPSQSEEDAEIENLRLSYLKILAADHYTKEACDVEYALESLAREMSYGTRPVPEQYGDIKAMSREALIQKITERALQGEY